MGEPRCSLRRSGESREPPGKTQLRKACVLHCAPSTNFAHFGVRERAKIRL